MRSFLHKVRTAFKKTVFPFVFLCKGRSVLIYISKYLLTTNNYFPWEELKSLSFCNTHTQTHLNKSSKKSVITHTHKQWNEEMSKDSQAHQLPCNKYYKNSTMFICFDRVPHSPGWSSFTYIAEAGLELPSLTSYGTTDEATMTCYLFILKNKKNTINYTLEDWAVDICLWLRQ